MFLINLMRKHIKPLKTQFLSSIRYSSLSNPILPDTSAQTHFTTLQEMHGLSIPKIDQNNYFGLQKLPPKPSYGYKFWKCDVVIHILSRFPIRNNTTYVSAHNILFILNDSRTSNKSYQNKFCAKQCTNFISNSLLLR